MVEFIAKSGKKVVVNTAPWVDAKNLKAAIEKEASKAGFKFDMQADISSLLSMALSVDSSPDVETALYSCLARCTRDNNKITMQTFDAKEAREDYYEIVKSCLMENFAPLVVSLLSVLPANILTAAKKQAENTPKSE